MGTVPKDCLYVKNNSEYQRRKDIVLFTLPKNLPKAIKEKYEDDNNSLHSQIAIYDTLRTHICPKCESPNLKEEWEERFSFLFFSYKCENCRYKWSNFHKQIKYSLKLIKGSI